MRSFMPFSQLSSTRTLTIRSLPIPSGFKSVLVICISEVIK